jgi:Amt family ammonium transporter
MVKSVFTLLCASSLLLAACSSTSDDLIFQKITALENQVHELERENQAIEAETLKMQKSTNVMSERYTDLKEQTEKSWKSRRLDLAKAVDHLWLLICGAMVMLMQAGFAMVEAGSCRFKNVQNILMKNLVDVCMGTVCWFAIGYTLAYGFDSDKTKDVFAGNLKYFGHEFGESDSNGNQTPSDAYLEWFFQWAFCATAATIVSGGVAERINMPAYLIYTIVMTSVIYPIVVAWMWSTNGWLTAPANGVKKHLNEVGFNDFAGSGIVHLTGGMGALVGAIVVGPRKGRFEGSSDDFTPHSLPMIVLGTFILWFGWYGFNCGSTLGMSDASTGRLGAIVAMNTTLSASGGGLVVLVLRLIILKRYDIGGMCNGILGGLVSITAGCGNVDCGWAVFIGIVGGIIYQGASSLLQMIKVDDPIDAFAVHGACGIWGVLAAAIFDWGAGFDKYNGFGGGLSNAADWSGNTGSLWKSGFAAALVEVAVIIAWVGGLSLVVFVPLRLAGVLRVPDAIQEQGMDVAKHSPRRSYTMNDNEQTQMKTAAAGQTASDEI